jgi:PilZ domain
MVVTGAYRPHAELRKRRRKPLQYSVWVVLGPKEKPLKCTLCDVSDTGARVTIAADVDVPEEFFLLFTIDGSARRHCRPVWRNGDRMGIEFVRPSAPQHPG